jgi:hypothetical protein
MFHILMRLLLVQLLVHSFRVLQPMLPDRTHFSVLPLQIRTTIGVDARPSFVHLGPAVEEVPRFAKCVKAAVRQYAAQHKRFPDKQPQGEKVCSLEY